MQARKWRGLIGVAGAAIVVAIAVKIVWFPDSWDMQSTVAGGRCTVRRGWAQSEVALACGPPDAVGVQPKVVANRPAPHEWISFCSAPREERRGLVVLYDCDMRVADVARATPSAPFDDEPAQLLAPPKQ
jgi:hypothetical protein